MPKWPVQLTLDKTSPVITATTGGGITALATVQVTANDPTHGGVSSNIVAAEWFVGTDPGYGAGNAVTGFAQSTFVSFNFPVTGQLAGASVHVRVMDLAGNWSTDAIQVIP